MCTKSSVEQKKCAAKGLQKKKKVVVVLDSNLHQYSQLLQGGAVTQLFILWFFNGMQINFYLHHGLQRTVADKQNHLEAYNKLCEEAR